MLLCVRDWKGAKRCCEIAGNSNCWQFHSNERIAEPCKAWPEFVIAWFL